MHLVKWIRKNTSKIMVFVIIFAMLAFVIGQFGLKMIVDLMGGNNQLIGTYDDKHKIKSPDFIQAQNELTVLKMLMADRLLLAQSGSGYTGPLLASLLFPDSQFSGEIASQMKRAVQQGQLQMTQSELEDFFQQKPERPEILWILLNAEAKRAGCVMPKENALQTLRYAIPQMTGNQMDAAMLVSGVISKNNISEEQILRIFSDLLAVLSYANDVMNSQAVTINQIKAELGRSKERIDAEFVKIDANPFIDETAEITDEQLRQQFEKYNAAVAGNPTQDNPFGFGYRLPERVQLEYMIVLMDDVEKQIEKPTAEALEEYYSRNIDQFTKSEPSDPNNPDSEKIQKNLSFAEAQASIRRNLESEKTNTLANIIFNEIKDKTETGFETVNFDEASAEQLQKAAGDYVAVSKEMVEKYQVPIVTGQTGWISRDGFSQDKVLNTLGIRRGQQYLRLSDLAFAATMEKQQSQRIGVPSIRVWENIGPASGGFYSLEEQKYSRLMALVRVIGIRDAQIPDSIDVAFDTQGVTLNRQQPAEEASFSLKEQVKQDVLTVRAMETAKTRAQELAAMAADTSWDDAIAAYNKKYATVEDSNDLTAKAAADEQIIDVETTKGQLRMSQTDAEMARRYMLDNPGMAQRIKDMIVRNMLNNQLYAMLPENTESTGTIEKPLVFDPQAACYVVKEVIRKPATMKDYLDNKAQTAFQLNGAESAGMALIQFSPEKILERMNYQSKLKQEPVDQQQSTVPSDEEL
ncbi:MAG: hypothetical protein OEV87_02380 [Phycisphaerae bacterium]|nr:hypothetical protein [Phycisphaerae bacterium]